MSSRDADPRRPAWLAGRGVGPQVKWSFGTDGRLISLACSRESGDLFASDEAGTLYRLDRRGRIASMTRLPQPLVQLDWSDDGAFGAGIIGDDEVVRFDRDLHVVHKLTLPDDCLAVAISPFGNHLAVSLADGVTAIYNERKRRITRFETIRPLSFLRFCTAEPILFGAAEHGLLCCHDLSGAEIWQQKNWSNVGKMCITGDGDLLYLASFAHGVQTLDGDGAAVGSYVLEGTVHRMDVSFEPQRLIVSTVERSLYWLDADGELLWGTTVDDDVVELVCDPLGEWAVCGFKEQGLIRLDWGGI
jgi:hypothetical protein